MSSKRFIIYTDGASRGNPGRAAYGVVIADESGQIITWFARCIGITTNNQAEYQAVIAALKEALRLGASQAHLYSDSELIVRQLNGSYRVRNPALKPLYLRAKELASQFEVFAITYIPRGQNTLADRLADEALASFIPADNS